MNQNNKAYTPDDLAMKYINILALLLSIFSGDALAWSSFGEADVQIRDGNICFTVTDKEFERLNELIFWGYTIEEKRADSNGYDVLWGFNLDKSIPLKKGDCIQYGQLPEMARLYGSSGIELPRIAPTLRMNVVYSLHINALRPRAPTNDYGRELCLFRPCAPTHGYITEFCLNKDKKGELAVKKVMHSCD